LEKPDAGQIWLGESDIAALGPRELRAFRPAIQLVFQDAVTSMNTRMSAAEIIEEPLLIQKQGDKNERRSRVEDS